CARDWLALLDNTSAAREFLAPGADADTIRKLATPLWLVYGEHSRNLPSLHGLQALLPTARVDIVAGAGHFFPISHHARVLPQLERFLGVSAVRDPPVSQPVFDL
ncbi:MAG TPA: alpha/beta hydrolase, partial [Nevskiaceae bacterium]|nr:alpha/beta hydrolase [Nevskiaceae bacterium]